MPFFMISKLLKNTLDGESSLSKLNTTQSLVKRILIQFDHTFLSLEREKSEISLRTSFPELLGHFQTNLAKSIRE